MKTGTRTQVPVTARSGRPRILRASLQYFCSSSVSSEPSSTILNWQRDHVVGDRDRVDRRRREVDRRAVEGEVGGAVRRLGQLLGELAHRVDAAARHRLVRARRSGGVSPASSCRGLKTGMATMVVQFGLATMPLGIEAERVGVGLGHDERHVGVHAPGRRVVDDDGAGRGQARGELARHRGGRAAQGEVDARRGRPSRRPRPRCPGRPRAASCRPIEPRPGTAWT